MVMEYKLIILQARVSDFEKDEMRLQHIYINVNSLTGFFFF